MEVNQNHYDINLKEVKAATFFKKKKSKTQ